MIRVTGTDVDAIPRFRFKPETDRMVEKVVMALKFRVELVWEDEKETASSIYLTGDGRVILQGRAISADGARHAVAAAGRRHDQRRPQA